MLAIDLFRMLVLLGCTSCISLTLASCAEKEDFAVNEAQDALQIAFKSYQAPDLFGFDYSALTGEFGCEGNTCSTIDSAFLTNHNIADLERERNSVFLQKITLKYA